MFNKVWFRRLILTLMDAAFLTFALFFALMLRSAVDGMFLGRVWERSWEMAYLLVLTYLIIYWVAGLYNILWRLADAEEFLRMLLLGGFACLITMGANILLKLGLSTSVLALTGALSVLASMAARMGWRMLRSGRLRWRKDRIGNVVMVVGAGEAGAYVIKRYLSGENGREVTQIILVDDDQLKMGRRVHGIRVCGMGKDIPKLVKDYDVKEIIVAIPSLTGEAYTNLIATCNATKCHVRVLSDPRHEGNEASDASLRLRELNISDFLSREEVKLDTAEISGYLEDHAVLISGGGGSIGSELCRQVMRFNPKQLIILDFYENDAYTLQMELRNKYGHDCPVRVLIGSIRERERLEEIFDQCRPQVVFHAAAHKHVPLMEESPAEAVKNNVFGTQNLLEVAQKYGVRRFVQLSTDKAVNPSCIMGATKRVAEILNQVYGHRGEMKCMVVRFGNVLGSHGSVIPLFESQIKAGGPVTITHEDVTRYFMTIPEAAQLVLQAGSRAESGATYVLEMGRPVRIVDLANQLIRFYGYEPNYDMPIVVTGLREGEKLHEELLSRDETLHLKRTEHKKIMLSPPIEIDEETLFAQLDTLREAARYNNAHVAEALIQITGGTFLAKNPSQ